VIQNHLKITSQNLDQLFNKQFDVKIYRLEIREKKQINRIKYNRHYNRKIDWIRLRKNLSGKRKLNNGYQSEKKIDLPN
jgi:hypothetical protein